MAYELEMRQMAANLAGQYGTLLEARCLPAKKIELIFDRATIPLPTNHIMQFGYSGTGPKCFHTFLQASGFSTTLQEIETVQAPHTFKR